MNKMKHNECDGTKKRKRFVNNIIVPSKLKGWILPPTHKGDQQDYRGKVRRMSVMTMVSTRTLA
jgi:hypothetical protein